MDFEFTEEQKLLKDVATRITEREIVPLMASCPEEEALPKEACLKIVALLQPLGALGCRVPVEYGGSGLGPVGMGIFCETLPYDAASIVFSSELTATRVCIGGTDKLKQRMVPPLLAGVKLGGSATSEPNVGSDPRGVETKAVLDGDHYVINGTKIWVSSGVVADTLMVNCSIGRDELGRNVVSPIIVERAASPFKATRHSVFGLTQGHLAEVVFDNCRVPAENLLAEASGHFHKLMTQTWLSMRPCLGLCSVNVAQKALDASIAYAKERKQFGKPIGSFQLIQVMIVEMATLIEASRLLCYKALDLVSKGTWASKESSMAKHFAAETSLKVTNMAVEIHGSYGITKEFPVEKLYRDARVIAFPDGTIEIQKLIVGREILGIRAFA